MKTLSSELVAIIATGVALAGLLLASRHRPGDRLLAGQHQPEDRLRAMEREQVRIRALLEGAGFADRPRNWMTGRG